MKFRTMFYLMVLVLALTIWAPFVSSGKYEAHAQNTISGIVFGVNRQPMAELYVELINDFGTTISRTRTTGSGFYKFSVGGDGRFTIRVNAVGTDYEDGEASVEIVNFLGEDRQGNPQMRGRVNEQTDVYLRLRKGVTPSNAVVFAQDIPPQARKLFVKANDDMDNKRTGEGLSGLMSAIEIFPTYYAALERLGTEYVTQGRPESFQAAVVLFTNAVKAHARGFKSWYGLAYAQYSLGAFPEALTSVQKAVELNANSPEAVFLYGVLLKKVKKYEDAEKQLLKAKELSKGKMARVHLELATLYGNVLNRYSDAAKELKLFLKAQPDTKDAESIKKLIAEFESKAQKG